jgi:hypothetical protein
MQGYYRTHKAMQKNGKIVLTGLPFEEGQQLEVIVLADSDKPVRKGGLTAKELVRSDIVGIWKNRKDIKDTISFARELRKKAESRNHS